jgi:phage shock protein PspC (stress-responsive transcriptional regulator)
MTSRTQSRIPRRISAFASFWYDFIIGDDWLTAAGVVAGLALTYALSRAAIPAWWLLPVLLALLLPLSLWRASRRR